MRFPKNNMPMVHQKICIIICNFQGSVGPQGIQGNIGRPGNMVRKQTLSVKLKHNELNLNRLPVSSIGRAGLSMTVVK